jgi:S-disulfanyl-L-cysteine oxidoreductase SoxD
MRSLASLFVIAITLAVSPAVLAQGKEYKRGRTPTPEEVQAWDISVGPAGKELPPGSGTAKIGAGIFEDKCVVCHGENGEGSKLGPRLMRDKGDTKSQKETIGTYWPFATTVWDWINRAMPRLQGGSLTADEVYALTAFLLYRSDIIQENTVIDAKSLPKVEMPNRNGFVPGPWPTYPYPIQRPFGLYP